MGSPTSASIRLLRNLQLLRHQIRIRLLVQEIPNARILLLINHRPVQLRSNRIAMDKDPRPPLKEAINVLQAAIRRLGIEEIRNRHEARTQHGPDDPEPPAQIRNARRRDLRNHVVADPVRGHGERGALGAHLQRVDFRRVQPGHAEHAAAEGREEDEEEGHGHRAVLVGVRGVGLGER